MIQEINDSNMTTFLHYRKTWILDDNGEPEDGCVAIIGFVAELGLKEIGTLCGTEGNKCFVKIMDEFPGRPVHGWYDKDENVMVGMLHIKCSPAEADRISSLAEEAGGSLRPNGESGWPGWYEFEIE